MSPYLSTIDNTQQSIFTTLNNLSSQHSPVPQKMTDPYYADRKHKKREFDYLFNSVDATFKIPKKCFCRGAITVETDERGRNFYVCKDFKVILEFPSTTMLSFPRKESNLFLYIFLVERWFAHPT